jgi:hypothetical protein
VPVVPRNFILRSNIAAGDSSVVPSTSIVGTSVWWMSPGMNRRRWVGGMRGEGQERRITLCVCGGGVGVGIRGRGRLVVAGRQ